PDAAAGVAGGVAGDVSEAVGGVGAGDGTGDDGRVIFRHISLPSVYLKLNRPAFAGRAANGDNRLRAANQEAFMDHLYDEIQRFIAQLGSFNASTAKNWDQLQRAWQSAGELWTDDQTRVAFEKD